MPLSARVHGAALPSLSLPLTRKARPPTIIARPGFWPPLLVLGPSG